MIKAHTNLAITVELDEGSAYKPANIPGSVVASMTMYQSRII